MLNADDEPTASPWLRTDGRSVYWFSRKREVERGAFVRDDKSSSATSGGERRIMPCGEITLKGAHNLENVLAAVAMGSLAGVEAGEDSHAPSRTSRPSSTGWNSSPPSRGVDYYNDSKATNVDATIKALEAFPGGIHLILGGKDKGSDYSVLNRLLRERVRRVYTIGAAAAQDRVADRERSVPDHQLGTLGEAIRDRVRERSAPAKSCCWRLLAPVSTSSTVTKSAAASSRPEVRALASARWRRVEWPKRVSVDKWLFGVTLLLVFIGLIMVFSASAVIAKDRFGSPYSFLVRQLMWALAGLVAMVGMMNFDYRRLKSSSVVFTALGVTTLLLLAVFFLDRHANTHRWIRLGGFSLQPSELAKPAIILFLAYFLEKRLQDQSPTGDARCCRRLCRPDLCRADCGGA